MTVTTDTFTAANGSGPPSPWVAVTASGSQSVQSNKWHIVDGAGYAGTAMTRGATTYTNVDITAQVTLNATLLEQYPAIGARMSGGTNGWGGYCDPYNGYFVYLIPQDGLIGLATSTATSLAPDDHAALTIVSGHTYYMRLQCLGTTIRCRAWDATGGEPGTWAISYTNSAWSSGLVGFRDQAPAASTTSDWDNFVLDDAPGGGTGVNGNAATDLTLTAGVTGTRGGFGTVATPLVFTAGTIGTAPTRGGGAALVAARAGR